jgi:hypothetical protein
MILALPNGLCEMYERILWCISQRGSAHITKQVFRWTGVVRRLLTLGKLRKTLAVQPGDTSLRRNQLINGFEHMAS